MLKKFFKTFDIKERWWDTFWDYEKKYVGEFRSYQELYKALRYCNSWGHDETRNVIKKECKKEFPKITDEVLIKLILILGKHNISITASTRNELINSVLYTCLMNKNVVYYEVRDLFREDEKQEVECCESVLTDPRYKMYAGDCVEALED